MSPSPKVTTSVAPNAERFQSVNFAWIIVFLRNGGERPRAIWLTRAAFGIDIFEAREWVDSVKLTRTRISRAKQRRLAKEYPSTVHPEELNDYTDLGVSHWPKPDIVRSNKQLSPAEKGLQDQTKLCAVHKPKEDK